MKSMGCQETSAWEHIYQGVLGGERAGARTTTGMIRIPIWIYGTEVQQAEFVELG